MEILILEILLVVIVMFIFYILKKVKKSQLRKVFILLLSTLFWICLFLVLQYWLNLHFSIPLILFEYFIYIGTCFLPIALFFTSLSFTNTKIVLKKQYYLLFVIPIISLIVLWTNELHHLFYQEYSININDTIYGPYGPIHLAYTYVLLIISIVKLLKYSIKNAGFFSKQSILIVLGVLIPIVINILGSLNFIPMTIYITPISFTFTVLFFALAIFKFDFLSVTPIALQRIVDRMSDSYVVLNDKNNIIDFNKSFLNTFKIKEQNIRNINIFEFTKNIDLPQLENSLQSASLSPNTASFEAHIDKIDKYFNIEVGSIINKNVFLGTLILFKDITQHIRDLETIKSNQDMLVEKERFASLGQMIGGIAHNLKTPIMSISGAIEALTDLVKEYDSSIDDPEVTKEDHHEIANDMSSWISKIKTHTSYMSDVITAVKGQAVEATDNISAEFSIDELIKRISILMKHELSHSLVELNIDTNGLSDFILHGDINSLVQVINNLISNAIQSYNGDPDKTIDFIVENQNNSIILSIKDYGSGMSKEVQDKLFKGMITTKGKNGTGLGLFMSYSNIKAHFNGNITFSSEPQKGTTFNVILPCR